MDICKFLYLRMYEVVCAKAGRLLFLTFVVNYSENQMLEYLTK